MATASVIIKNECHSNIIVDRLQGCSVVTKALVPETEAKAARQLIGIGYSISINIKYM